MAIAIQCGQCGNNYRIDDKLAGRRVKCKNCGGAIPVPAPGTHLPTSPFAASVTPHEDDILGGLKAASQSETQAAASPPAMAYPTRSGGQPTAAAATHDCPACASTMPSNIFVCANCGFNIRTNSYVETRIAPPVVAPPPVRQPRLSYASEAERDSKGFRRNVPFSNPGIEMLNRFMVGFGYWLFMILLFMFGIFGLWGSTQTPTPASDVPVFIIVFIIVLALLFLVFIPILIKGMEIAGGLLRFRFPDEDTFQRLIASWSYIGFSWTVIGVVVLLGAMFDLAGAGNSDGVTSGASLGLLGIGLALKAVGFMLHVIVQFITAWFFFRLKFVEALVTTLLMLIFQAIASVVVWLIIMGLLLLAGMLFTPKVPPAPAKNPPVRSSFLQPSSPVQLQLCSLDARTADRPFPPQPRRGFVLLCQNQPGLDSRIPLKQPAQQLGTITLPAPM